MKRYIIPLSGFLVVVSFLVYRIIKVSVHPSLPEEALVRNVIDGDTIEFSNGTLVRYIGIDTPEIRFKHGDTWVENPETLAHQAKQANEKLVLGRKVRLEYDEEKYDRYNRLLGYVFVDDVLVNEEILRQGLGFLMTIPPNTKYTGQLHAALIKAKKSGKGIWDSTNTERITADEASSYIGRLAVVEGTILRATKRAKVIFLNFGRDEKKDFTGVIFRRSFDSMEYIGKIEALQGKRARITGIIKEYNGPEIIINSPEQLEIITSDD